MSELNHEIDRDNLNKPGSEDMARILFPNGRKRYVEELDDKINLRPPKPGSMIDRGAVTFWKNNRTVNEAGV